MAQPVRPLGEIGGGGSGGLKRTTSAGPGGRVSSICPQSTHPIVSPRYGQPLPPVPAARPKTPRDPLPPTPPPSTSSPRASVNPRSRNSFSGTSSAKVRPVSRNPEEEEEEEEERVASPAKGPKKSGFSKSSDEGHSGSSSSSSGGEKKKNWKSKMGKFAKASGKFIKHEFVDFREHIRAGSPGSPAYRGTQPQLQRPIYSTPDRPMPGNDHLFFGTTKPAVMRKADGSVKKAATAVTDTADEIKADWKKHPASGKANTGNNAGRRTNTTNNAGRNSPARRDRDDNDYDDDDDDDGGHDDGGDGGYDDDDGGDGGHDNRDY